MSTLIDYKNRVTARGAVTEWLTSDSANWRSLSVLVTEREYHADVDLALPAFPNPSITLSLNSGFCMEHFSEARWRKIKYTRGTGVLTPAGHARLIRPAFRTPRAFKLLHLVVPQDTVDFVANEVQKPGTRVSSSLVDFPFFDDPVITNLGFSAISALRGGAPDFFAQAAAQWIAAHLLLGSSRRFEWHQSLAREQISDYRLVRVLEYIEAHLSDRLDLHVLSKEAGISPFHFATLFRKAMGATPHRHVEHLRMEAARAMLRDTDKSILDIALTCGFGSASHFAAVFRKRFSQSPTEYRSSQYTWLPIVPGKIQADGS
jgi:AraC family transcriptional regulator